MAISAECGAIGVRRGRPIYDAAPMPTRYETTRVLMRPVTAIRRRRTLRQLGEINQPVWEAAAYRPAMRRYYEAGQRTRILLDVDVPPGGVVLDVGAYEGAGAARFLQYADRPEIRVLCFEPLPDAAEQARRRFEDDPRVEVFDYGLAGRERHEQLSIAGKGSSTFTSNGHAIEILLRDIDAVLDELGVDEVTLAKVNIEGGEYELIDRLVETGRLSRVRTLIVQFHEFVPGAHRLRRRARRLLSRTHGCTWSYPWIFERWDRV